MGGFVRSLSALGFRTLPGPRLLDRELGWGEERGEEGGEGQASIPPAAGHGNAYTWLALSPEV